jgi:hypothetical protein
MTIRSSFDSLLVVSLIIILTGLQTLRPLVPLHRAIGQPQDSAMMVIWRVLVWTSVYAPALTSMSQRPIVTGTIVIVSVLLGQNTYPMLLIERPIWLDILWVCFLIVWSVELFQMMTPFQQWKQIAFSAMWFLVGAILFAENIFSGYASAFAFIQYILLVVIHTRMDKYTFYSNSRVLWQTFTVWILIPCASVFLSSPVHYLVGISGIRNFAGQMLCNTGTFSLEPVDEDELREYVLNSDLRVAGGMHSWANYMCPSESGNIVRTTQLRSIEMQSNGDLICGAGVTMGSIVTYLKALGRQLEETWHSDVTLGGAVATGVHHRGSDFMGCCVSSVRMMLGNGEIVNVDNHTTWNGINVWNHIPGSVGLLGIVVELTIKSIPLSTTTYIPSIKSWTTEQELTSHLDAWIAENVRNDVLFVIPIERRMVISSKTVTPLDTDMKGDGRDLQLPVYSTTSYAINGAAFDLYASFWSTAYTFTIGWFLPLNLYGGEQFDFVIDHLTEASHNAETRNNLNRLGTEHATIEIDLPIDCSKLSQCVRKFSTLKPYTPLLEIRYATNLPHVHVAHGECVLHVDFSIPLWLLDTMQAQLSELAVFCPSEFQHHGKSTLLQTTNTRLYKPPPSAQIPASMISEEFQKLQDYADPSRKFMYAVDL